MVGIDEIIEKDAILSVEKISLIKNYISSNYYSGEMSKIGNVLDYISKDSNFTFKDIQKIVLSIRESSMYNNFGVTRKEITNFYIRKMIKKKDRRTHIREGDLFLHNYF